MGSPFCVAFEQMQTNDMKGMSDVAKSVPARTGMRDEDGAREAGLLQVRGLCHVDRYLFIAVGLLME